MSEAYLPFFKYILLQLFVGIVGLNAVREKKIGYSVLLKSWIFGQMLLFAVLQFLAVPLVFSRCRFDVLFWSYLGVCIILFAFGCWRLRCKKIRIRKLNLSPLALSLLIIVILLILWQACNYFFGIHLDQDDARFIAQANDALEYGRMYIVDVETGEFVGNYQAARDITSPWSMMLAIVSKILLTKPVIFAHTVFPPIELFVVYGIYWLIGRELFRNIESQLSVVFLAIVVNLFFTVSVYTQSTFTLIRIWQGKASVAAVIVPMFVYLFVCINKRNQQSINLWIMIIATGCAACLMSGAGIPLSFVAIATMGFYNVIAYRQWKRIPMWLASMTVPLGSGMLYLFLKGSI